MTIKAVRFLKPIRLVEDASVASMAVGEDCNEIVMHPGAYIEIRGARKRQGARMTETLLVPSSNCVLVTEQSAIAHVPFSYGPIETAPTTPIVLSAEEDAAIRAEMKAQHEALTPKPASFLGGVRLAPLVNQTPNEKRRTRRPPKGG